MPRHKRSDRHCSGQHSRLAIELFVGRQIFVKLLIHLSPARAAAGRADVDADDVEARIEKSVGVHPMFDHAAGIRRSQIRRRDPNPAPGLGRPWSWAVPHTLSDRRWLAA